MSVGRRLFFCCRQGARSRLPECTYNSISVYPRRSKSSGQTSGDDIENLLSQFKNPASPFYLAPGEKGPAWPEPSDDDPQLPLSYASSPTQREDPTSTPPPSLDSKELHASKRIWPEHVGRYDETRSQGLRYARENGYDVHSLIEWPVAWGETDQFRHINNVAFARYFETARIRVMQTLEDRLPATDFRNLMNGTGTGLVIKTLTIDYKRPVNFPDSLLIMSRTTDINQEKSSFNLEQVAWSLQQGQVVSKCKSVQVMYDFDNLRKGKMTDTMRQAWHATAAE